MGGRRELGAVSCRGRGARGGKGRRVRARECVRVCSAKHLTFLIEELAALPVIALPVIPHFCVYECCPVQNGFLSVNHHVLLFQRVFCRISFAEHRGQYLG